MNFYKHQPLWGLLKQVNCRGFFSSKDEFFNNYIQGAESSGSAFAFRRGLLEQAWESAERPYYNLYPAIIPMLLNLRLDIPCSTLVNISVQPIEVRLPEGLESPGLVWPHGRIKSVLMGLQPVPESVTPENLITGMVIAFDIGEVDELGHPILAFKFFPLREDMTIEDAANLLPADDSFNIGVAIPQEVMTTVVRLCACIALIDSDSDIIAPDVLNKDKDKWDGASDLQRLEILRRAKDKGKNGWNVGAEIEYAPHFRRPHPALVRVGKGRKLTRIVMRKGSVVHRNKIVEVPSGYEGSSD